MTIEILTQLQAIEDFIPEGGLVKAYQLRVIHELLDDSFMYLQPTSITEVCKVVESWIIDTGMQGKYVKITRCAYYKARACFK